MSAIGDSTADANEATEKQYLRQQIHAFENAAGDMEAAAQSVQKWLEERDKKIQSVLYVGVEAGADTAQAPVIVEEKSDPESQSTERLSTAPDPQSVAPVDAASTESFEADEPIAAHAKPDISLLEKKLGETLTLAFNGGSEQNCAAAAQLQATYDGAKLDLWEKVLELQKSSSTGSLFPVVPAESYGVSVTPAVSPEKGSAATVASHMKDNVVQGESPAIGNMAAIESPSRGTASKDKTCREADAEALALENEELIKQLNELHAATDRMVTTAAESVHQLVEEKTRCTMQEAALEKMRAEELLAKVACLETDKDSLQREVAELRQLRQTERSSAFNQAISQGFADSDVPRKLSSVAVTLSAPSSVVFAASPEALQAKIAQRMNDIFPASPFAMKRTTVTPVSAARASSPLRMHQLTQQRPFSPISQTRAPTPRRFTVPMMSDLAAATLPVAAQSSSVTPLLSTVSVQSSLTANVVVRAPPGLMSVHPAPSREASPLRGRASSVCTPRSSLRDAAQVVQVRVASANCGQPSAEGSQGGAAPCVQVRVASPIRCQPSPSSSRRSSYKDTSQAVQVRVTSPIPGQPSPPSSRRSSSQACLSGTGCATIPTARENSSASAALPRLQSGVPWQDPNVNFPSTLETTYGNAVPLEVGYAFSEASDTVTVIGNLLSHVTVPQSDGLSIVTTAPDALAAKCMNHDEPVSAYIVTPASYVAPSQPSLFRMRAESFTRQHQIAGVPAAYTRATIGTMRGQSPQRRVLMHGSPPVLRRSLTATAFA